MDKAMLVWYCAKATFIVGTRADGATVLTCLDDGSQHEFSTQFEAAQWSEEYTPEMSDFSRDSGEL